MRNMKQWRACRKAVAFAAQMAVLSALVGCAFLMGMIAHCQTLAEGLILLGILAGMAVCAGIAGWESVEFDRETNREWREYRRMTARRK